MVIMKQVNKDWNRTKENMDAYCVEVRKLGKNFLGLEFHHVERENNVAVDVLSKLGSSRAEVPYGPFVNELSKPSISDPVDSNNSIACLPIMEIDMTWAQPLIDYIRGHKLPEEKPEAE